MVRQLRRKPAAKIDYPIIKNTDKTIKITRVTWRSGLFECFTPKDAGFNCLVAHCCCGPCIWNSAMKLVPGLQGEDLAAGATFLANQLNRSTSNAVVNGGSGILFALVAAGARARVRQSLVSLLFPQGKSESFFVSLFYHCCPCIAPCAWVQEVDAVMTWSEETYDQKIYYGSVGQCACLQFVGDDRQFVYKIPYNQVNDSHNQPVSTHGAATSGVPLLAMERT